MADPQILIEAGWTASVRRLLGYDAMDTDSIPDEQLKDDLVLQEAEDYVKDRVSTWETIMADTSLQARKYLIRAVIYMVAHLMSDQGYYVQGIRKIEKDDNKVTFADMPKSVRSPASFLDKVQNNIYLALGTYVDPNVLDIHYPTTDVITGDANS